MNQDNPDTYYQALLNAIPSPVFVVDEEIRIVTYNEAASALVGDQPQMILQRKGGDAMYCLNAAKTPAGCGHSPVCQNCVVRNSVRESLLGRKVTRLTTRMNQIIQGKSRELYLLVTTAPVEYQSKRLVLLILEDFSELVEIRRVLPICAGCKMIRDDQSYWNTLEAYFKKHWQVDFTHGLCPECVKKYFPDAVV